MAMRVMQSQREEGGDPSTLMPDKEERKRNRRRRIEARQSSHPAASEQQTSGVEEGQRTGQRQLGESMHAIDIAKREGIRCVTDVRVDADAREVARRLQEEQRRQERLAKLQDEVASTSRQTAVIEGRWNQLLQLEIPQQLAQEIAAQNEICRDILASKDGLVSEFHLQLRQKDESYIKSLKEQAEAIDEVLSRMRAEFHELRLKYESETHQVEHAFAEERQRLIHGHNAEIDSLFDRRRANEATYKQTKHERESAYQRELEALIVQGSEQQNQLKIELETNIQMLKQQLADIRATYQLNAEKLDYNYNVLTELEKEKDVELTRYKRRLVKLKDQLSHHMTKYNDMESVDSKKNDELTEDYRRLTHKYKDLQSKFRHFEVTDSEKYNEVWQMHEDECKDMIDRLLKADCVVGEQVLGWKWVGPDLDSLSKLLTRHNSGAAAMTRTASDDSAGLLQPLSIDTVSGIRIRAMLQMLASEAGFLLQPQVHEMLESMPTNEAEINHAEALLRALGIKNEKQLKELSAYFFRDTPQGKEVAPGEEDGDEESDETMQHLKLSFDGEEAPEVLAELKHMIVPDDFLRAVEAYLRDQEEATGTMASSLAAKVRQDDQEVALRRAGKRTTAYWDALADVVSSDSIMVWKQLRKDLDQHIQLLSRRSQLVNEVQTLAQQNIELKEQLREHLTDPRNQELQVPPTHTIQVRPLERISPFQQTQRTTAMLSSTKQRTRSVR